MVKEDHHHHDQLSPVNAPLEVVQAPADQSSPVAKTEELAPRVWNLRPRKPVPKKLNNWNDLAPPSNKGECGVKRNRSEAKVEKNSLGEPKKKVTKLSIPLTKGEIEEDFIALTGSKPRRRPKKRSRTVQKQLDFVFPGLWLSTITPALYKVARNDKKTTVFL